MVHGADDMCDLQSRMGGDIPGDDRTVGVPELRLHEPGLGRRGMSAPRGEVTGVHLLNHPRVRPAEPTSPYWTQAERDRFVSLGIAPVQQVLPFTEASA